MDRQGFMTDREREKKKPSEAFLGQQKKKETRKHLKFFLSEKETDTLQRT